MMRITLSKIHAPVLLTLLTLAVIAQPPASAQSGRQPKEEKKSEKQAQVQPAPLLKRTTTRRELKRLGYGGSVTIDGAPEGSVTVEAWQRSEVEVTAEVEQSADTEENLTRLAALNTFAVDEDVNHVRVMTVGLHDRKYAKRAAKGLPKHLLSMPWRIDYHVKVPAACDLVINAGRGALVVTGVEGALRINAGGGPDSLFALAGGDVDAEVLRAGRIDNAYAGLAPRERTAPTERSLQARAGNGGATLSFTVGDGTLRIRQVGGRQ